MLVFSNRIPLPRRAPHRATRHQMRRRLREYQGEQRRAPRRRCITNRFVCFYFFLGESVGGLVETTHLEKGVFFRTLCVLRD